MIYSKFEGLGVQEILAGSIPLLLSFLFVLYIFHKQPRLAIYFFIAYGVRLFLLIINFFVLTLPDSGQGSDVGRFLDFSHLASSDGFSSWVHYYTGFSSSYFHAWIAAFFYVVFGESAFLFGSLSFLFSIVSIYCFWLLYSAIWKDKASLNTVLVAVLLPSVALYSVIPRYEVFIWSFILIGFLGVYRWSNYKSLYNFLLTSFGFLLAGMFHSPFYLAYAVFIGIVAAQQLHKFFIGIQNNKLFLSGFMFAAVFCAIAGWFVFGGLDIPKIGTFESIMLAEDSSEGAGSIGSSLRGSASYPAWTAPNSAIDYLWKPMVRGVYFLFSPFPWDVRSAGHLIGLLDAFIFIFIAYKIWCNRKFLLDNKGTRNIIIIVALLAMVYGLGVGNFGTGVRHKTKFAFVLLALAGPLFVKRSYFLKQKIS
jgi:hypothetical protein